jgi:hypothetical protein
LYLLGGAENMSIILNDISGSQDVESLVLLSFSAARQASRSLFRISVPLAIHVYPAGTELTKDFHQNHSFQIPEAHISVFGV